MNILDWIKKNKTSVVLALVALFGAGMFFVGRGSVKVVERTTYVQGKTQHDTIPVERLVPYAVLVPATPALPLKPDTVWKEGKPVYIALVVDTAKIIADYAKENKYNSSLFDNETEGSCSVDLSIQYNKLKRLSYAYTPIQKVIVKEKIQTLTPFVSGRYSTQGSVGIGGGCFYHDIGLEAMYCTDMTAKWVEIGAKIKF